jgi:hypothetical protein
MPTDAMSLAHHANDRRIWRNLRDRFPHPYGLAEAEAFSRPRDDDVADHLLRHRDRRRGGGRHRLRAAQRRGTRGRGESAYWLGTDFWVAAS